MRDIKPPKRHAKYSASGAERWFQCPGSVKLSEGIPAKDNIWSVEGTRAHEILEVSVKERAPAHGLISEAEMLVHADATRPFILNLLTKNQPAELLIEHKVSLDFIHPEAFGTLDYAITGHFGRLHICDYKYGKSLVSPKENLQFLFYALGVAHQYDWNFNSVVMWALQPRVRGFDGFTFWEISIKELRSRVAQFTKAIERVEAFPNQYNEGNWCHFCVAKGVCPLKADKKVETAKNVFKGK